jgi:tripartite-type tricarboxylate transporter receptor subunit TctC
MRRREALFCTAVALLAAGIAAPQASAQAAWPTQTVTLVVPYPPGGTIDRLAREFGEHLAARTGKPVVVENRAGGNGIVGVEYAKRAAPDGHTLLIGGGSTHTVGPATDPDIKYDPIADFTPVAYLGDTPMIITAGPSMDGTDFKQLIAKAKAAPNKVSYGSVGHSTVLAMRLLGKQASVQMRHVNYKQFGPTLIDLVRGDIDLGMSSLSIVLGNVQQKMVRPIAVTSKERSKLLPEVPAIAESYPDYEVLIWFGLFASAGLPEAVRTRLHTEVTAYQKVAGRADKWAGEAFNLRTRGGPEFAAYLKADHEKWRALAEEAGLRKVVK